MSPLSDFAAPVQGPQRIVCLTEESTEWLYLLGQQDRIVGISGYTVRPPQARHEKPRVSAFLSARIERILELQPDCVLGFSDLQVDIASALIRHGVPVTITNQRSVAEIFSVLLQLACLVGQEAQGRARIAVMQKELLAMQAAVQRRLDAGARRPRVYFEEWDEPAISAIRWVSELVHIAGGEDCFPELAVQSLGRDRIIADPLEVVRRAPEMIIGSWCGKKFRPERVAARAGWADVPAVAHGQLFEVKSPEILQPGPAALTDGVRRLHAMVLGWMDAQFPAAAAQARETA